MRGGLSNDADVEFYGYDADEEAIAIAKGNASRLRWEIKFKVDGRGLCRGSYDSSIRYLIVVRQ